MPRKFPALPLQRTRGQGPGSRGFEILFGKDGPAHEEIAIIGLMTQDRQTIGEKTARLESVKEKVKQFVDSGGDLKSPEAVPLGVEFIQAYDDLAKEFGCEILKPIKGEETKESKNTEALLKMFDFDKKRELEKYCRDVVINSSDFANFILACELGSFPLLHKIHYRDHVPEHLYLSDQDTAALAANPVGPLQPDAQKAVRKISQMFKDRRYLVGHIFYLPDLSKWHFFQFDQRDLEDERGNHWKEGAHVHFLNWLWPNYDATTLWENFTSGKAKMNDSLHVRYLDNAPQEKSDGRE
jgi:hypothetical protein